MLARQLTRACVSRLRVVGSAPVRGLAIAKVEQDDEYSVYPRENVREGLHYALNWSLNGDGVTPKEKAWRLTKKADGARHVAGGTLPSAPKGTGTVAEEVDDLVFEPVFDECVAILEKSPKLYVAEGDAPGTRTPTRVISDDPAIAASAMAYALDQRPLRKPEELPITCYLTPSGPDFAGLLLDEEDRVKILLSGAKATVPSIKASAVAAAAALNKPTEQTA